MIDKAKEIAELRLAAEDELVAIEAIAGPLGPVAHEAVRTAFKAGASFGVKKAMEVKQPPSDVSSDREELAEALREAVGYLLPLAEDGAATEPAGASNGLTYKRLKEIRALYEASFQSPPTNWGGDGRARELRDWLEDELLAMAAGISDVDEAHGVRKAAAFVRATEVNSERISPTARGRGQALMDVVRYNAAARALNACPQCGGPADNGHDRCYPPNPYYCSKCEHQPQPGGTT